MKHFYLTLLLLLKIFTADTQVLKEVDVSTPGTFSSLLTPDELNTVTNLTLTGIIDARDIFAIRDLMPELKNLNIKAGITQFENFDSFELPANSFLGKTKLEKVLLSNGLFYIRENAFKGCVNLSGELIIPRSVFLISHYAFENCRSLTGVLNLSRVGGLGVGVFNGCSGLTGLIIPSTIGHIGHEAFKNCVNIRGELIFPDRVISIGSASFSGCVNINKLSLSKELLHIDQFAFYNCYSINGSLTIPEKIRTISRYSFANCFGFDGSLTFPDSINSIEEQAFSGCSSFIGKLIIPDLVNTIGSYAFANCKSFSELKLSESLKIIPKGCFQNCSGFTGSLNFSNKITEIQANSFENCSGFTSLGLSSSITKILSNAFKNCSGFNGNLDIPSSVISIGSGAFEGCDGFSGLSLPNTIKIIADSTFLNCTNLSGVLRLQSSVTSIGKSAFENCSNLSDIELPKTIKSISQKSFFNCSGLNGVLHIPSSLTMIGHSAFEGCTGLTGLDFKASVMDVGNKTFKNCNNIAGLLDLPGSLHIIGNESFMNCKSLTGLIIPSSVSQIGFSSFEGCEGLKFIRMYKSYPSDITLVGENIFLGVNMDSCILYVPRGSKELYSNAPQWKNFRNIVDGVISTVQTLPVTDLNTLLPKGNGEILNFDVNNPTICGFVWDTIPVSSISNASIISRTIQSKAKYSLALNDLSPNTTYYVKSFVTNETGTSFGEEVSFKTIEPKIELLIVDSIIEFTSLGGTPSVSQYFVVSGNSLGDVLTISAPNGFEIRQSGSNNFTKSITINPVNGTITSRNIEFRLSSSNTYGEVAGNIVCSSKWAVDQLIFVKGKISKKLLSISLPEVVKNKMYDGKTDVKVLKVGDLSGYNASDANSLTVSATAFYDNADVGTNKKITVTYMLSGSSKDKYETPSDHIFNDGKISDFITISPLSLPVNKICSGDSLLLHYSVLTGAPTHYRIIFDPKDISSFLFSTDYKPILESSTGALSIFISNFAKDGTYTGNLVFKNELSIESPKYPFTFTINVSSLYIDTKFGDVLIIDNIENRFSEYQWYKNGIKLTGANRQFYYDPEGLNGEYSVVLKTITGEIVESCSKIFVSKSDSGSVNFPNPVRQGDSFVISLKELNFDNLNNSQILIYNLKGECVYKDNLLYPEKTIRLNEAGFYVIKIELKNRVLLSKIIVN